MTAAVLRDTRAWAEAIAALPAPGPLPARTVLVPGEPVAHSLRRELVRAGHTRLLAGTRFMPLAAAALAVIHAAGTGVTAGEEALRPARLLTLFRGELSLRHFSLDLFRTRPGWDHAFARTIGDLEDAGLRPEDLDARAGDLDAAEATRLADVATVWRMLDASAGPSWTRPRLLLEAARLLEDGRGRWPFPGATLATLTGRLGGAEARFVRAIADVSMALLAGRPLREPFAGRVRALLGAAVPEALEAVAAPAPGASERDLLAAYFFAPPAVLADPARPRSGGPDGTVDLEQHAGIEAELEAAADWVARQVLRGIPLEDIAVLVPALDPLGSLIAQRLARLPWIAGGAGTAPGARPELPIHVAGGLPLTDTAAGTRALAVIRALRQHLAGDALAAILPSLRTASAEGRRHLSRGAAMDLVWSLGTTGGDAARPEGALDWAERAIAREPELAAQLARAHAAAGDPEQAGLARGARDLERLLEDLREVTPALLALGDLAARVIAGAPLAELWPALRDFLARWLLQPGEGARIHAVLDERLAALVADGACGTLAGDDALRAIEEVAAATRRPAGRFGEPAIYVGSLAGAVGLRFQAVRVLGLAEGHLPAVSREDPVLPDGLRARLGGSSREVTPPTAADHALEALHALDLVIRDTGQCLALSAPRLDLARSLREPSSVMLEAAAALGRPHASTGEPGRVVPDAAALARDAFAPARRAAGDFRSLTPLGEPAWQDGVAARRLALPARWQEAPALDLAHARNLPLDGILGPAGAAAAVPGLDPEWPISPSKLQALLQCPHLFFLDSLLGLQEPAAAPSLTEIGQPAYGGLVHRVAEEFYRTHGPRFGAREETIETWREHAGKMLEDVFAEFLGAYPLLGEAVRKQQRERLRHDVLELLDYDWNAGTPRRFVAVERGFGRPVPVPLAAGPHTLYVRGQIDRLDVEGGTTLVRDLKTARPRPRAGHEEGPEPVLDIQVAVYGFVTRAMAGPWGVPARVAAAYAYVGRGAEERAWRDDFDDVLAPAATAWLETAAALLAERAFPRTPRAEDCTFCRFRPVCGEKAPERAAHMLANAPGVLARFGALKGVPSAGGTETDDAAP